MKFVYFGYDMMLSAVSRLLEDGHELIGICSFATDNQFSFNGETLEMADTLGIPSQITPATPEDIQRYIELGAELFISIGYPHKIPDINETRAKAVNIHPALLPQGRGIMPTPYIITAHPESSGITAHKITADFDAGDILKQIPLPLNEGETVETLSARISMALPDMVSDIVTNIDKYWEQATPQDEGKALHFPPPSDEMRTLDWTKDVKDIDTTARAFGRYGSIAIIKDEYWIVYALDTCKENHDLEPGAIACLLPREVIMAAKDGFVCLKDLQKVEQQLQEQPQEQEQRP